MKTILKYKLILIGIISGAIAGYAYYHFAGCENGSCAITSKPLNSTLYGAVMGGLLFSSFRKENSNSGQHKNQKP